MQNSNDDPNDQIYNHDDLQDEPHSSIRATFWTSDSSLNDSQSTKRDTQRIMTKAQIHTCPKKLPSNKQKFQQRAKTEVLDDASTSSNSNLFRYSETQKIANDTFRSHDNREIVMANDEAFGALDSQHDDIQQDANNDLSQQLLPTLSDKSPIQLSPDAQTPIVNSQNDGRNVYDIIPNDIPPNAHIFDDIPIPPERQ
jgi:hypothetical protein